MDQRATHVDIGTDTHRTPAPPDTLQRGHPLAALRHEIDRLLDRFTARAERAPAGVAPFDEPHGRFDRFGDALPAVDFTETDDGYRITAELPGIDEKDIDVSVADDLLTISGEKSEEKEETHKDYRLSERRYGAFRRSFSVPAGTDVSRIAAEFSKGVLTVTLPRSASASRAPHKVEIRSA